MNDTNESPRTRLNIGAGVTYIPGFVNIDISAAADLHVDLSTDRLPFEDGTVDLIFTYHTLEHVPDYLHALSEMHRVLKHGGVLLVGVPYVTLTEYHLVNPYHRHNFNEHSFSFFNAKALKGSAAEENAIVFDQSFHRFHYMGGFRLLPNPLRRWCRRHLFNVVRKIDFGLVAVKSPGEAGPAPPDAHALIRQFDACLKARTPYRDPSAGQPPRRGLSRLKKRLRVWWGGQ